MNYAPSLEEALSAAGQSLCPKCGAPAPPSFDRSARDLSDVVLHVFTARCSFCQGPLRVVFLVPIATSPEAPPSRPAAAGPAESGKSWVVQYFEEAERHANESFAEAEAAAEASGKERFDLARFERLLNRGSQARRERVHLYNYYVIRSKHRTLQAYVNELIEGEPWDQLACAPPPESSSVENKVSAGPRCIPIITSRSRTAAGQLGSGDTVRTFWVKADLSSYDLKFGTTIESWIKATHPPTESEALTALAPIAHEELRKRGDEGWAAYSISNVQIVPPEADAPTVARATPGRRVDLRLVAVTERRHPTTNELAYQVFKSSADGDSIANVLVCADRIELDDSQIHTSPTYGAAVAWSTPTYQAVIRRGEPGWPDEALTWIRTRFGDAVASEVDALINDAGAFRE